eukprot:9597538-Lingulodinium_polyedra.AAC.1
MLERMAHWARHHGNSGWYRTTSWSRIPWVAKTGCLRSLNILVSVSHAGMFLATGRRAKPGQTYVWPNI